MKKKTIKMGVGVGELSLKDIMKAIVEKEMGKDDHTVKVGTLSPALLRKFRDFKRVGENLESEIDMRMKELAIKMERQLKEEFDHRQDELNDLKDEFWESLYDELNLDPRMDYTIKDERYVHQVNPEEEEEGNGNVFKFRH